MAVKAGDVVRIKRAGRTSGVNGGWEWTEYEGYVLKVNQKTADVSFRFPYEGSGWHTERTPLDRIRKIDV